MKLLQLTVQGVPSLFPGGTAEGGLGIISLAAACPKDYAPPPRGSGGMQPTAHLPLQTQPVGLWST